MSQLPNTRHERFAQEIAAGKSLEDAHRAAGYKGDRRNADALRKRKDISRRIHTILHTRDHIEAKAVERAIERTAITKQRVLEELAKIGFANMADYTRLVGEERVIDLSETTRDQLAAVQEISVEDFKDGRGAGARDVRRVKLKLGDKKGALVDIGREIGMFIARSEVGKPGDFSELTDGELADRLVDELVRGGIPADAARDFARIQLAAIKH